MYYPKELRENLRYRFELFEDCRRSSRTEALVRDLFRRDILFAFNVFFWTYDTRTEEKDLPFVTYEFQDEVVLKIDEVIERGEHLFIDKTRDMGATWMVLCVMLWRWLTKSGEQYIVGSFKQERVDESGNLDTHFEKLRYTLARLPFFLLPRGYDRKRHQTFMKLVNTERGNAIIGEATNANFGRGGRPRAILFDEFQAWEMAEEAWKSASDATQCKIALGTPHGMGNKFSELSRTDEIKNKIRLIWWKHPKKARTSEEYLDRLKKGEVIIKGKTIGLGIGTPPSGCYIDSTGKIRSQWYDEECARRQEEDVKENIDCDYLTTGRPVFDTLKCEVNLRNSMPPKEIGDLIWDVYPRFDEFGRCLNINELKVKFIPNYNGKVKIWELPEDGYENGYCIAADCAEGLEQGDYDSASVLKRFGEIKTVATLHGRFKTHDYADELAKLGVFYKYAFLAIEREGHSGGSVIAHILKMYNRLFHKEIMTKGYAEATDRIGWFTTSMSKPVIIGNLSKLISLDLLKDPDEGFWNETLTFVNDDGKLEAQGKSRGDRCYDDRVMDRAILYWIHNQLPLPIPTEKKVELIGWRAERVNKATNEKLVGWIVENA